MLLFRMYIKNIKSEKKIGVVNSTNRGITVFYSDDSFTDTKYFICCKQNNYVTQSYRLCF